MLDIQEAIKVLDIVRKFKDEHGADFEDAEIYELYKEYASRPENVKKNKAAILTSFSKDLHSLKFKKKLHDIIQE